MTSTGKYIREVPMSGCLRISNMGRPTIANTLKISFQVRERPPRLAK